MSATIIHGNARRLPLADACVDAIVTDPPYALPGGFMGKTWDRFDGREDAGFAYWLMGLIDGEGHFGIKRQRGGSGSTSHVPFFALKMRADERRALEYIRRELGIGQLQEEPNRQPNPMVKWVVQTKPDCQRLVDVIDKYGLRAKKRMDFAIWRQAVCEWTNRPRGNRWHGPADDSRMIELKQRIELVRTYVDPPWSGNEFQDWCRLWAAECLRVLKPGGHLLAFGGTRTYHRMACAIEDAGFEIRDSLHWIYGSGFPKSLDVSKAIDKRRPDEIGHVCEFLRRAIDGSPLSRREIGERFGLDPRGVDLWAPRPTDRSAQARAHVPTWEQWVRLRKMIGFGDEMDAEVWRLNDRKGTPGEAWEQREVLAERTMTQGGGTSLQIRMGDRREVAANVTAPATDNARRWSGWGTALKPAHEPIVVARKPFAGTVAGNVLTHGTGALNIDACRTATEPRTTHANGNRQGTAPQPKAWGTGTAHETPGAAGRWPTNLVVTHAACNDGPCAPDCPVAELDRQSGIRPDNSRQSAGRMSDGFHGGIHNGASRHRPDAAGGASRYFPIFRYEAKAPAAERPRGADGSAHVTVKPLALMRWLVRLVTPPGGLILDPFLGSGTTAEACLIEGFRCIGIEVDAAHLPIIRARMSKPIQPILGGGR